MTARTNKIQDFLKLIETTLQKIDITLDPKHLTKIRYNGYHFCCQNEIEKVEGYRFRCSQYKSMKSHGSRCQVTIKIAKDGSVKFSDTLNHNHQPPGTYNDYRKATPLNIEREKELDTYLDLFQNSLPPTSQIITSLNSKLNDIERHSNELVIKLKIC